MGWKSPATKPTATDTVVFQSAFAGYGLEIAAYGLLKSRGGSFNPLSLDMGWKCVYPERLACTAQFQSAFAGYGLKEGSSSQRIAPTLRRRNPLSLDMGWKSGNPRYGGHFRSEVAIRFR